MRKRARPSLGIDPEDLPRGPLTFFSTTFPPARALPGCALRSDQPTRVLVVPATLSLASADVSLADRPARERTLARVLDEIRDTFDVIVIDCSPSLGLTTINALVAADDVLVPFKCETLSHRGLGQLMESIDEVKRWSNPDLRVAGIVPTMFDGRTAHAKAVLADIGPRYGVRVFEPIPRSIRFAEAPAVGRTILATAPSPRCSRVPATRRGHLRRVISLARDLTGGVPAGWVATAGLATVRAAATAAARLAPVGRRRPRRVARWLC